MDIPEFNQTLDLRGFICPINFVKAKKELESLPDGNVLEIILDGGEPVARVPLALKEAGHRVLKIVKQEENTFALYVRKGE